LLAWGCAVYCFSWGVPIGAPFLLCESCADYTGSDRGRIKLASNAQKRVSC